MFKLIATTATFAILAAPAAAQDHVGFYGMVLGGYDDCTDEGIMTTILGYDFGRVRIEARNRYVPSRQMINYRLFAVAYDVDKFSIGILPTAKTAFVRFEQPVAKNFDLAIEVQFQELWDSPHNTFDHLAISAGLKTHF